jgi:hypothetical protein
MKRPLCNGCKNRPKTIDNDVKEKYKTIGNTRKEGDKSVGSETVQNPGTDDNHADKSLNRQYDYTVKSQIRKEGLKIIAIGTGWIGFIFVLMITGLLLLLHQLTTRIPGIIGAIIFIVVWSTLLLTGPYFLIVGIYQWISGVRTITAKKFFGELRFDKKTIEDIKPPVVNREAKDTHLSHEFCPFCGGSNISESVTKYNSLTGALECDACGAIWSPPRSKTYSVFVLAVCVALLPCVVVLCAIGLYKSEMPFISIFGFCLLASFVLGAFAYVNIMVLKGKRGQFEVHRQPYNCNTSREP